MSYINATHEMANLINFEKFVDTVAQLSIEENRLTEQTQVQLNISQVRKRKTSNKDCSKKKPLLCHSERAMIDPVISLLKV